MRETKHRQHLPVLAGLWRAGLLAMLAIGILSCDIFEPNYCELWTDIPELALYAAEFNNSQSSYKVHVSFKENLPASLSRSAEKPALLVGRYLNSQSLRPHLQSIDYLFNELQLNERGFYPSLFAAGNFEGKQLLLPVSFNLPMIVFSKADDTNRRNNFIITAEELEEQAAAFDRKNNTSFTRMGFSPRWSPEFMLAKLQLHGADFREANPLRWNRLSLEPGIANIRSWLQNSHGSTTAGDDFLFRYLYIPEHKAIQEERIQFAYMDSASYFTLTQENRSSLAYRWFGVENGILVDDDLVFAAMVRRGEGKNAAEAFLRWFYREDSIRQLLTDARTSRLMEYSFGIAGGFSALRSVNERLFPEFYPSLLGKLPPASFLRVPEPLPADWQLLKRDVILPFLMDASSEQPPSDLYGDLDNRLRTWLRQRGDR